MKSRQEKANEIRDLITQINARVAELQEDGYSVVFSIRDSQVAWDIIGKIRDVKITRVSSL